MALWLSLAPVPLQTGGPDFVHGIMLCAEKGEMQFVCDGASRLCAGSAGRERSKDGGRLVLRISVLHLVVDASSDQRIFRVAAFGSEQCAARLPVSLR